MLELNRDIDSHSPGKVSEFIRHLMETEQPIALTINGKADLLVQDQTSLRMLIELSERIEELEITRQSIAEMDAGRGRSAEEMLAEMRQILAEKPHR